jgi:hypothetical protein
MSCYGLGTATIREPRGRVTSAVGNRYQRTGEDRADRKDSVHALLELRNLYFIKVVKRITKWGEGDNIRNKDSL